MYINYDVFKSFYKGLRILLFRHMCMEFFLLGFNLDEELSTDNAINSIGPYLNGKGSSSTPKLYRFLQALKIPTSHSINANVVTFSKKAGTFL